MLREAEVRVRFTSGLGLMLRNQSLKPDKNKQQLSASSCAAISVSVSTCFLLSVFSCKEDMKLCVCIRVCVCAHTWEWYRVCGTECLQWLPSCCWLALENTEKEFMHQHRFHRWVSLYFFFSFPVYAAR